MENQIELVFGKSINELRNIRKVVHECKFTSYVDAKNMNADKKKVIQDLMKNHNLMESYNFECENFEYQTYDLKINPQPFIHLTEQILKENCCQEIIKVVATIQQLDTTHRLLCLKILMDDQENYDRGMIYIKKKEDSITAISHIWENYGPYPECWEGGSQFYTDCFEKLPGEVTLFNEIHSLISAI